MLLDNANSARPDWAEYWPIRNFLLENTLEDDCWYGFFSPRFREKTGLSYAQVDAFLESAPADAQVALFSAQADIGAFFPNVFVGEDMADRGFLETSQRFFDFLGLGVDGATLLMDSSRIVFSNFIVAKPAFWREWQSLTDRLYQVAEQARTCPELYAELNLRTGYRDGVQRKVFMMERMASLVLCLSPELKVCSCNPFKSVLSPQLSQFLREAIICDALKIAAKTCQFPEYLDVYESLRNQVLVCALGKNNARFVNAPVPSDVTKCALVTAMPAGLKNVVEVGRGVASCSNEYLESNPNANWVHVNCDLAAVSTFEGMSVGFGDRCTEWGHDADAVLLDGFLERSCDPLRQLSILRKGLAPGCLILTTVRSSQHWRYQARRSLGMLAESDQDAIFNELLLLPTNLPKLFERAGFRIDVAVPAIYTPRGCEKYLEHFRNLALLAGGDAMAAENGAKVYAYAIRASVGK